MLCGHGDVAELRELQAREQDMLAVVNAWAADNNGRDGGSSGGNDAAKGRRDEDASCRKAVEQMAG